MRSVPDGFLPLANAVNELVFVWRPTGEMLWVNRAFETEVGMTASELCFRSATNPVIHPEDLPSVVESLASFSDSPALVSAPIANRFFDTWGRVRSIVSSVHKVDWCGEPAFLSVSRFTEDATQQARDADFRSLVETADDGILKLSASGRIVYSNRRFRAFSGRSLVELAECTVYELLVEMDRPSVRAAIARAASGAAAAVTARLLSGAELDIRMSPLEDADQAVALLAIARDVTAYRAAERALEQKAAQLRMLSNNLPTTFLYQLVIHPDQRRQFTYVSAGVERMHGVTVEQALADSSTLYTQMHEDDAPRVTQAEHEAMRSGMPFATEVRFRTPEGLRWRLLRSTPHQRPDGSVIFDGVEVDVTGAKQQQAERVRLEKSLLQAQKMESVGRLAGGVAHDFNNMLTAIIGNLELARMQLEPTHPVTPLLSQAAAAAESSADLTRQLLAFSRKQIVVPKVVDLNDLLRELSSWLARMLGEDIRLELSVAADLGTARVDPGQIKQVVMNLAINSRDAMPRGGVLELSTQNRLLDAGDALRLGLPPGQYVALSVRDTGSGMPPEVRSHLFEPFFTTKGPGKGTGLGLATAYGVIKQSHGGIEVHSELGRGSEFQLLFPRLDTSSPKASDSSAPGPPHGTETILLVEDEHAVRNVACSILERLGYRVLPCANARDALEAIELNAIDLLLTDVVMPGMGGRELATRVLERVPEVPVLYTSGYAEDVVMRKDVAEEAVAFIAKPYSLDLLAHKVRTVLDTHSGRTPRRMRRR